MSDFITTSELEQEIIITIATIKKKIEIYECSLKAARKVTTCLIMRIWCDLRLQKLKALDIRDSSKIKHFINAVNLIKSDDNVIQFIKKTP